MDYPRFLLVTFLAAIFLLLETVLFHVVDYLFDYFYATAVISYAVLGIGLGAFIATWIRVKDDKLYLLCSIGMTVALYGAAFVLVRYQFMPLIAASISLVFFFPVLFIAVLFRRHSADKVYLFDMAGAGLGVIITVVLYAFLKSEGIVLLVLCVVPLVALVRTLISPTFARRGKIVGASILLCLIAFGGTLFTNQVVNDSLNVVRIFNREGPYDVRKIFNMAKLERLKKSYDNLVGRIDLLVSYKDPRTLAVCYNGYANDHINPSVHKEYSQLIKIGLEKYVADKRVLWGVVDQPKIFIVGSAARGITQTAKKITPANRITATEINPAIIEIMTRDFYKGSGKAYRGLNPVMGNAISYIKSLDQRFDIITLINTHTGRTIGHRSGPDYLHTRETYNLFFDHLSDEGYLLLEERPFNRGGTLGVYRMINTLWHTLKERGVEDPSRHFFIWEWMHRRHRHPEINLSYAKDSLEYVHAERYYQGMIVSREPIVGEMRDKVIRWHREIASVSRLVYLKDVAEWGEMSDLFGWLEQGDLSALEAEGFDTEILTNDRPFASLSTHSVPEIVSLVLSSAAIFVVFGILCIVGTIRHANKRIGSMLALYNILIGLGYFFIEILLLQVYQNLFVSPFMTLVFVLGFLLISSGIGGLFADRIRPVWGTIVLLPVSLVAVYLPSLLLAVDLPQLLGKLLGILLICTCGFLMGIFFPGGLIQAGRHRLKSKIPFLFAINSVAGSFAVVLALYSGIKIGYSITMVIAILAYCLATLILQLMGTQKRDDGSIRADTGSEA